MAFLIGTLDLALQIYGWIIIARAILSWLPTEPGTALHPVYRVVYNATEPYLSLFRRFLPTPQIGGMGIDLSSLVGFVVILLVRFVLVQLPY